MADGLNSAQLNEINQSINNQGKDITNAISSGSKSVVDGLHEAAKTGDQQVVDALNLLPDQFKEVYKYLGEVVENLTKLSDITEKTADESEESTKKSGNADKIGISTTQKDTDVAGKVPLKYAAPALMLNKTFIDLLGKNSLLFKEIQKITGGQTTKDKLDEKKEEKGGGKKGPGLAPAAMAGVGGVAAFGVVGAIFGLLISSATLFAKTPFGLALKAMIPAKKFAFHVKGLIKGDDGQKWPTAKEMLAFTKFCTGLKLAMAALLAAAQSSSKLIMAAPMGLLGIKFAQPFINAAIQLIEKSSAKQIDIKKFTKFCVDLKTALSSLFFAAIYAFLLLFVIIPGLIGLKIAVLFINAAIKLIQKIDQRKIKNLNPTVLFLQQMKIVFKELVSVALYATIILMLGISGIMGVGMAFLFLMISLKMISATARQAQTQAAKGGELDQLFQFVKKLRNIFKILLITMLFAMLAGILAIPATIALLGIAVFLLGVSLIGMLAKVVKPYINTFNSVSIFLAISLLIFAIAFYIITQTMTPAFFAKAILTMVGVTLIFATAALIGFAATFALPFIASFALAAIMLAISFLLLYVGILILNFINITDETIEKIRKIGEFFVVFAGFVKYFIIGAIAAIFFAVASALLLVGMILFTITLFLVNVALGFLDALINEKPPNGAPGGFETFGGLAMIAMFFLAIGGLTPFAILAMIAAVPLLIAAVLLMVAFIALTITFFLSAVLLGFFDALGADIYLIPIILAAFFLAMLVAAIPAIIFIIVAVPILIAAVMLLAIFIALTVAFALALALNKMKLKPEDVKAIREAIYSLYDIFGIGLMLKSLKVMIVALPVLGAAVMIMGIMVALVVAYKSIEKLDEMQDRVDPKVVIDSVMSLMDIMKQASEAAKGMSIKTAIAFAITLKSITEAIDSMVDVIIKLDYFNTPDGEEKLKSALLSLHKVIDEFFLDKTNGVLGIFDKLEGGISKSELRAAEALAPITEAISNITDVIIKLNNIENIDQGIANTRKVAEFVKELIILASGFTPEPKGVLGAIGGFLLGDTEDSIKSGTKVVKLLPELIDELAKLNDSVQGITNISEASQNVLDLSDFVLKLTDFAGKFKKGGIFGGGSTEEEIRTSIRVVSALHPMINELTILNGKVNAMGSLAESSMRVKQLSPFVANIMGVAIFLSENKERANKAVDAAQLLVKASNELVKLSKNVDKMETLKASLENNIVAPLMELEEPANRLNEISRAVTQLNSALTRLARENKDTLKTVASIGNTSGSGILGFVGKIIGQPGQGTSMAESITNKQMAANIAKIQRSVQKIDEKITKDTSTWTAPGGGE
jgi:hypothetical protein